METFSSSHDLALCTFASYFLLIFLLLYIITSSIRSHASNTRSHPKRALLFVGLSVASFVHTWYWMFQFMNWSFHDFERKRGQQGELENRVLLRLATWLKDTGLFKQAWSTVCMGPLNWWWSEQLCLFTAGAFTVFMYMQRGRVPHVWAYMLLGQIVAISVAWSLFNLAMVVIPPARTTSNSNTVLPVSLTIPVLLSFFTVSLSPYTSPAAFLPNLLAMHALLILPLIPLPSVNLPWLSPVPTSFYTLLTLLSMILRMRTTLAVLSSLHITSSPFFSLQYPIDMLVGLWNAPGVVYGAVWETLHSHPAQASIGWDVVWSSVVWLAWGLYGDRSIEGSRWTIYDGITEMFSTAVASVGVAAPMGFGRALREEILKRE